MKIKSDEKYQDDYQQKLLNAIYSLSRAPEYPKKGLSIYQNNLIMTAARSLSITYPVIETMVGEQSFFILAKRLLTQSKPNSGDWADWGRELSTCLAISELDDEHPYLKDIANLEWAFHEASRSPSIAFDDKSLNRLSSSVLENVYCTLSPAVTALSSEFPQFLIWEAHRGLKSGELPSEEKLSTIMKKINEPQCCIVFQNNHSPKVETISKIEFDWIEGVRLGMSISSLLDIYPAYDVSGWLTKAIKKEWIVSL